MEHVSTLQMLGLIAGGAVLGGMGSFVVGWVLGFKAASRAANSLLEHEYQKGQTIAAICVTQAVAEHARRGTDMPGNNKTKGGIQYDA